MDSTAKFWLIENLWQWLRAMGVGERLVDLFTFLIACAVLGIVVWVINTVVVRVVLAWVRRRAKQSKTEWDDVLVERKFFQRLLHILPLLVVIWFDDKLFAGFSPAMISAFDGIAKAILIVVVLLATYSLLDTWNTMFQRGPAGKHKSIKGYLQVAKIVLGFMAGLFVIASVVQKDPTSLLVGLGTAAALLSLVFKDTILGFVASIQLSAQDMVRPGDWIEMPSKNADGTVLDINVNSVKVQNWDNTITMIPIYSMVSESFTNWRGMEESGGRRFVRTFHINMESVRIASDEFLESLAENPFVGGAYEEFLGVARRSSPEVLTNMALLRANIELFLRAHKEVNDELPLYVRYTKEISDKGIGVELYAFSRQKSAESFDAVHRSVVEYVVAVAPIFNIVLFQSPSGVDFRRLNQE